jgi:hypothetical protein
VAPQWLFIALAPGPLCGLVALRPLLAAGQDDTAQPVPVAPLPHEKTQ